MGRDRRLSAIATQRSLIGSWRRSDIPVRFVEDQFKSWPSGWRLQAANSAQQGNRGFILERLWLNSGSSQMVLNRLAIKRFVGCRTGAPGPIPPHSVQHDLIPLLTVVVIQLNRSM